MENFEPLFLHKALKLDLTKHEKLLEGRWLQLKLDGVGCQAIFNDDGVKVYAMTKAKVSGQFSDFSDKIPHIIEELERLDFRGILQGEIIATHLSTCNDNFGFTVGTLHADDAVERQNNSDYLKLVIYDMPTHTGTYGERYSEISSLFKQTTGLVHVSLNQILDINYKGSWEKTFDKVVKSGQEGLILYDQNALYKHSKSSCQRNKGLLKVKASDEREVLCIEMIEGTGKYSGTLGAMECTDGEGRTFHIGSFNISDQERKVIWDTMKVPLVVEMIYYQQTPDSYKLPRLTRVRPDKDINSWNKVD